MLNMWECPYTSPLAGGKPYELCSKTRLTIYNSDVWHCALSGQECPKHDCMCCGLCPSVRGNEVIIRVKFWVGGIQPAQTLSLQFQSISECSRTLQPPSELCAHVCKIWWKPFLRFMWLFENGIGGYTMRRAALKPTVIWIL